MSTEQPRSFGQNPPPRVLRRTTTRVPRPRDTIDFETEEEDHTQTQPGDSFTLRNAVYEQPRWESDAQIAARKAMAKRNSRSFAARTLRSRSQKKEKLGITLDTSFSRHKGSAPRQVYPLDNELKSSGTLRKHNWLGLGRSGTKTKGLGITKGTPQPGVPKITTYRATAIADNEFTNADQTVREPKTADALSPGTFTWEGVSPSDGPIPIGISLPSDSIPDFSPYQETRKRSESDVTLVTPSIIITPAGLMKSVWSPDTASDYTGRSSSVYSRAFNFPPNASDVPPVPALPSDVTKPSAVAPRFEVHPPMSEDAHSHIRNGTLDSAVTAFEEDDEIKRKTRILSSSTFFEEDETPLRGRNSQAGALSLDTAVTPTQRRSNGWWNVITTPFEFSRANSVWTQNGRNVERTPDVPLVPQRFDASLASPSTPSTYIWSATERGSSVRAMNARETTSPLSAMSASPVLATAAIGTVLNARQAEDRPINIKIELLDRRPGGEAQMVSANSPPAVQSLQGSPSTLQSASTVPSHFSPNVLHKSPPQFAPPPTFAQKSSKLAEQDSRASSPDLKGERSHRKVRNMDWLRLFGRKQKRKPQENKKRRSKRCCCLAACCCILILILLAIIIPVIFVLSRRHNQNTPTPSSTKETPSAIPSFTPSQWLNLTGYPPIPTGISTIAQPEAVVEESGCVIGPATVWSCAVPKEDQDALKPNKADQPNFKLEITFENGTISDPSKTRPAKRAPNPVSAGSMIRSLLGKRGVPSPSPAPPTVDDQRFLGKTTDANIAPFEGEITPFFITFTDPKGAASQHSRLARRANDKNNLTVEIPDPALNPDGTAAPANLLPFPSAQPLRLYNRGRDDEHYGFWIYYDRSIFLKSITQNGTKAGNPADLDGGSRKEAASLRCTWAQTRFLVQIWTRSQATKPLLGTSSTSNQVGSLKRPGTFPYPVTVTLDRHGGSASVKTVYCYPLNKDGTVVNNKDLVTFSLESRDFGGTLVNPALGPTRNTTGTVDGGTGGCRCQWQNWLG
ncbi:hypothetical protein BCR34DRAFT_487314 [Clohesyomyces aquaticus]|uniref:Glycoprotease family protein n=1 Tax=Clohesyomyces aquaticus TaxID=1231657 RepID=A0A1Y1ZGQ7_9PLEO|nr:hypothetical protein BCR34DRAFT_487314 [Clohesyomyces aquaticus]